MRNPDGTYGSGDGKARATGGAVVAVLRLGGKVPHPDAILKSLDAGQREDGAWAVACERQDEDANASLRTDGLSLSERTGAASS